MDLEEQSPTSSAVDVNKLSCAIHPIPKSLQEQLPCPPHDAYGLSARRPASTACFIIARRTFRIRLAVAEERLGELKAALQDMRDQRDCWQAQAERLLLAPKPDKPLTWWKWMRTSA
jgi:hypothetical protein